MNDSRHDLASMCGAMIQTAAYIRPNRPEMAALLLETAQTLFSEFVVGDLAEAIANAKENKARMEKTE